MSKEIKIHPIQQYIIDQVRVIRAELDISAEDLSHQIGSSISLVGIIESPASPTTYTDHMLNVIADVFTKKAKSMGGSRKEYSVYSFYPQKPLSDVPQLKTKIDLPESIGLTGTLNAILETKDFFDKPHTIREVTDYCNSFHNKNWKSNNLTSTLDYAVRKGKLKKIELPDGGVLYQKA